MTYVLIAYILIREIMFYFERKDLYNRIMAKDLPEYKGKTQRTIKNPLNPQKGGEKT